MSATVGTEPRFATFVGLPGAACLAKGIRFDHPLLEGGCVSVAAGTLTDGASIPRPFRWFLGQPLETKFWRASLIHDVLYEREIGRRVDADQVFLDFLKEDDVGKVRRSLMWFGVRIAFWKGWGR
jgi:hypothetical protein